MFAGAWNAQSILPVISTEAKTKGGCVTQVTRNEKAALKFCDYHSFMSYSDFTTWLEAADETAPEMSFAETVGAP